MLVVRTVGALFNGIDFLEVADGQLDDPDSELRQTVLMVHLFLPVPAEITGKQTDHVLITGGSRITDIAVEWAVSADDLVNGDVSAVVVPEPAVVLAELAPLLPTTDRDALQHILIVSRQEAAISRPTKLAIVEDSEDRGPRSRLGFDLQLSRVAVLVKVDCPTDFDCLDEEVCPP